MKRTVIIASIILIIMFSYLVLSQQTSRGRFQVANEPPYTSDYEVRDSNTHWDDTVLTTHDLTTEIRWRVRDPNPDQITTTICIGTTPNPYSNNACTIANYTIGPSPRNSPQSYTYGTDPAGPGVSNTIYLNDTDCNFISGLCSKLFYVDLYAEDDRVPSNSSINQYNFTLLNQVPTNPHSFVPLETHDQTPDINWTAIDLDDGSQDHWPADTLTYHVQVGTAFTDNSYLADPAASSPQATVTNPIPWGTPGALDARTTAYARIWTTDNFMINSSNNDSTFELVDHLPQFVDVYLSDVSANELSCTGFVQNCFVNPAAGTYAPIHITYRFNDSDRDCGGFPTHAAGADLCLVDAAGSVTCLPTNANYSFTLSYSAASNEFCNFTVDIAQGNANSVEFFRSPGDYKIHVNASSQAGASTTIFNANWTYGSLPDIFYSSSVDLGDPSTCGGNDIQLGSWNPGSCLAVANNSGNVLLNLTWEATDFGLGAPSDCSPSNTTCWDITSNPEFELDDDNLQGESTETGFFPITIPETAFVREFYPSGGLDVCDRMTCDSSSLDETLDTYFHILPPVNLEPGTYETDITITQLPL
ncbi:MAG: hypothetical protein ABIE22_03580 [archaeon]